jgi:hypothetical protein
MDQIEFSMDSYYPAVTTPRRGRSSAGLTFQRDAPGPPIRTNQQYTLQDLLQFANSIAIHRENNDPQYRGEVRCFVAILKGRL